MGEQSVRTFIQAGYALVPLRVKPITHMDLPSAYVTFGDVNEAAGRKLESELGR